MKQTRTGWLKPSIAAVIFSLFFAYSCDKEDEVIKTYQVKVGLTYPEGYDPAADIKVRLRNTLNGDIGEASTNASGEAVFTVVAGTYEATASEERQDDYQKYVFNGLAGNIVVTDAWTGENAVSLTLTLTIMSQPADGDLSPKGRLVIKELYVGGCQKDDGSGSHQRDPYIVLYNNSGQDASIKNLTLGSSYQWNAHATSYFTVNGELIYANEDWIQVAMGAWRITKDTVIAPGEQIVIAMNLAVDHTQTYSKSVNLANPKYYVAYDPEEGYTHASYHAAPSELIPTSQYLDGYRFPNATGNAWTFSVNSPAFFFFMPELEDAEINTYYYNVDNLVYHSATGAVGTQAALKIPRSWVVDGIEVFQSDRIADSQKRLTPDIDAGFIPLKNAEGHTLYRNVDKAATEAILGNAGKIVYNYDLGTNTQYPDFGTTDPSGIDAEASIKKGARIIYKDTNNATNDFHQRQHASLRD
ncbi:MAG: DUF4876 domain-containing protein [Bacteroidales bacterium]|jgi:hypothetical protein|nr:DUF4876 domain-containing protein [Bacteroidales bacterium]